MHAACWSSYFPAPCGRGKKPPWRVPCAHTGKHNRVLVGAHAWYANLGTGLGVEAHDVAGRAPDACGRFVDGRLAPASLLASTTATVRRERARRVHRRDSRGRNKSSAPSK
eukprot:7283661-Prymnesium_polylepis.1